MDAHAPLLDSERPQLSRRRTASRGFTLIELMLVVVIIGVLSSFALPYFQRVTSRARRTEALMVLDKVRLHFANVYENTGTYGAAGDKGEFNPPLTGPAVGQPAEWSTAVSGWQQIPFAFEGGLKMRYRYDVATPPTKMSITVVGDMPGLGGTVAGLPSGITGNYMLIETLEGASSSQFESPAM